MKRVTLEVTGPPVRKLSYDDLVSLIHQIDPSIEVQVGDQGKRYVVLPINNADAWIEALSQRNLGVVPLRQH